MRDQLEVKQESFTQTFSNIISYVKTLSIQRLKYLKEEFMIREFVNFSHKYVQHCNIMENTAITAE